MRMLGNIIWLILGGFVSAAEYVALGIGLCFTIIGIPFGLQCFKLALLSLFPFSSEVVPGEFQSGCISIVFNIIWIFTGGLLICLTHCLFALLCAITIIGIPFAVQHMKLARLSLAPFGKNIISKV